MAVKSSRTYAWKKQRLLVLKRDGYVCHYCGNPGANEADHIIPKAKGGGDEMDNLVACCRSCNLRKGKKSQAFFLSPKSTPPVFISNLSPKTVNTPLVGPFDGQIESLWS